MTVHLFEMFGHTALIPAQIIMLGKFPMSQPGLVFRNKVNKFCHLANSRLIGHIDAILEQLSQLNMILDSIQNQEDSSNDSCSILINAVSQFGHTYLVINVMAV